MCFYPEWETIAFYFFKISVILYCPIVREIQAPRLSIVLDDVSNMWSFIAFCQVIISFYRQDILKFHSSQGKKTKQILLCLLWKTVDFLQTDLNYFQCRLKLMVNAHFFLFLYHSGIIFSHDFSLTYFSAIEVLHTGESWHGAVQEQRTALCFSPRLVWPWHGGAACWAPGLTSCTGYSITWRCFQAKGICFLKHPAWPAPWQLQLWGLWLQWEGCSQEMAARGKPVSVTHGARDWHVIINQGWFKTC